MSAFTSFAFKMSQKEVQWISEMQNNVSLECAGFKKATPPCPAYPRNSHQYLASNWNLGPRQECVKSFQLLRKKTNLPLNKSQNPWPHCSFLGFEVFITSPSDSLRKKYMTHFTLICQMRTFKYCLVTGALKIYIHSCEAIIFVTMFFNYKLFIGKGYLLEEENLNYVAHQLQLVDRKKSATGTTTWSWFEAAFQMTKMVNLLENKQKHMIE